MIPFIFKSPLFKDNRGFFTELWLKKKLNSHANLQQSRLQKKML